MVGAVSAGTEDSCLVFIPVGVAVVTSHLCPGGVKLQDIPSKMTRRVGKGFCSSSYLFCGPHLRLEESRAPTLRPHPSRYSPAAQGCLKIFQLIWISCAIQQFRAFTSHQGNRAIIPILAVPLQHKSFLSHLSTMHGCSNTPRYFAVWR